MSDVIRLTGLAFYGYHGVSAAEKETGRAFEVDCELDYTKVYATIREVVEGKAYALLEGLATELATLLLDKFPIYRVTLKVRKLHPPIAGQIRHIEVEVTRRQRDMSKLVDDSGNNG
jgi:dihydroneopterin aldolase